MKAQVTTRELVSTQVSSDDRRMDDVTRRWAEWLAERLGGRPQKYLTDRSDGRITQSAISRWMSGQNRPTPELAALVADIFGVDRSVALRAAGYDDLVPLGHEDIPPPSAPAVDPLVQEILDMDISAGAKRMLLRHREQRIKEFREMMATLRAAEQRAAGVDDPAR